VNEDKQSSARSDDAELEREIRSRRKFSLAEAIGRLGGGELMKGASPVTEKRQVELQVEHYLEQHLADAEGALEAVLLRRVRDSDILLKQGYEQPLAALALLIEQVLVSEESLRQFVNEVDAQWGHMYRERPYFQQEGQPPHQDDPYTLSSVRAKLAKLLEPLRSE